MSLLSWFRERPPVEEKTLDSTSAWSLIFSGYATSAGISVTETNIMSCPAARGSCAVLSESVAQLPLHLHRRLPDGGKERAVDHPLYDILASAPCDWVSSFEFRRAAMVDLLVSGHTFAFINRSRADGSVVELLRVPPSAVQIETDPLTSEPRYWIQDPTRREVDRSRIFHLQCMGGEAPLMQVRNAIGLSIAMEAHQAKLFANGARPSGVLKMKARLPAQVAERLGQDFNSKWGSLASSGKTMVLEEGTEFEPLTFSSVDLQMLELRRFQVAEIA